MTADEWNEAHPVGALVSVGPNNHLTRTRSPAVDAGFGAHVVSVVGRRAPVRLSEVEPIPEKGA